MFYTVRGMFVEGLVEMKCRPAEIVGRRGGWRLSDILRVCVGAGGSFE